jgi:hypothetical protein
MTIIDKIRNLIGDTANTFIDIFTYDNSGVFTLTENNVVSLVDVYRNDVASAVIHSYNSAKRQVTISSSLVSGDTIKIEYTAYPNYSDTELIGFINSAIINLSTNNFYDFEYDTSTNEIYPEPTEREANLIAIIASLLIEPDNKTIRLPDITINAASDVPTNIKISQTIARFKKDTHGVFDIKHFYHY